MRFSTLRVLLISICLLVVVSGAQAQLTFTLSPLAANVAPGNQVSLLATITNTSGEEVTLNGSSINSALSVDNAAFESLMLNPIANGGIISTNIFVQTLLTTSPAVYPVDYTLEFVGSTSGNTFIRQQVANITVQNTAVAPEPGYAALVGVFAFGVILRRRRAA